jgi:hypothetical protein
MTHGRLKKGLHECVRQGFESPLGLSLLPRQGSRENDEYKSKLIKGLDSVSKEGEVHVVMVKAGKDLGAWCGLAPSSMRMEVSRRQGDYPCTSGAVITDFSEARDPCSFHPIGFPPLTAIGCCREF